MVSLLALFCILVTIQAQTNNVCLWDRRGTGYLNNMLNGQYIYDGSHNSHSSWKKTQHQNCGSTELYIYWHQYKFWAISTPKGANSYYAHCSQSAIASCTAGNWKVAEGGTSVTDAQMRAISGNCPYWPCAKVTTTASNSNCASFTTQIGTNTWKASNNYVWYFNTMYMSWLCIDSASSDYTDCRASYQLKTATASFQALSSGGSTSLNIDFSYPAQAALTVTCSGSGGIVPTLQPVPTPQPVAAPIYTSASNICIWDRRASGYLNNMLNGQYIFDGYHSSHSSWIKTQHSNCGPSSLYIYWHEYSFWAVGTSKGADSYYAKCSQSNMVSCTAGQWQVSENSASVTDATMRTISGNCPYWSCASIATTASNSNCASFTTQLGTNTWKGSNNYVWYYSTMYMAWICVNSASNDYTDCQTSYQLKTSTAAWKDVSTGSSASLSVEFSSPTQATLTVTCLGSGQTLPTPKPTAKPTLKPTLKPTPKPVTAPVYNPASNPVTNPVTNPATNPVNNPATNPVTNPATNPVYNPAANPVTNPVYNPALNPVYNPALNPASNPALNPVYNPAIDPASNPAVDPVSNPVYNPASSPVDSGNSGNSGNSASNNDAKKGSIGSIGNWWIYVVIVLVVFCLCVVCICCLVAAKKRKGYKEADDNQWGDTVQMNQGTAQKNIYSTQNKNQWTQNNNNQAGFNQSGQNQRNQGGFNNNSGGFNQGNKGGYNQGGGYNNNNNRGGFNQGGYNQNRW